MRAKTRTLKYYFMELMIYSAMAVAFTMASIIAKKQIILIMG